MINIVIPMAGQGSRFLKAGYTTPKPFINVLGKTMIEKVLDNLKIPDAQFIIIARNEHLLAREELVKKIIKKYNCKIITIDRLTEGAACTVLLAENLINNEAPLLTANSDQIVDMNFADYIGDSDKKGMAGSILTFYATHPKWSYAKTDDSGFVTDVREKQPISSHATVGLYYFKKGKDFVAAAREMINNNDRTNNEFYVAPAYNYLIKRGQKIGIYEIKESQMHGLGTPEDLEIYLKYLKENTKIA